MNDFLRSLAFIPDAFKRTLNDAAIKETAGAVNSAGVSGTDYWSSYQRIYNWITSNIKYAYDVEMPYLNVRWSAIPPFGEHSYITDFDILMCENYVQTPKLTLEIKQGDCDDQAILAYARAFEHNDLRLCKPAQTSGTALTTVFKGLLI